MSKWPTTRAPRVLAALLRIGWQVKRQAGSHRTLSREGWPDYTFAFHGSAWRDLRARKGLGFLGDGESLKWATKVPLIVLQQGRALPERTELGLTTAAIPQRTAVWQSLQKDLASRSPSGELRTAQRSGHFIQTDEPDQVVQAVRDVLDRIRPSIARPQWP